MFKSTQESGDAILTSHGSSESSSELMSKEFGVLLASDVDAYVTILLNWSKYNTLISPRTTNSFNFRALVLFKFKSLRNNGSFAPLHIHNHTVMKRIFSFKFQKPTCTKTEWTVVNCRVSRSGVVCHRCHSLHQQQQHPGTLFCCCGNTDDY